MGPQVSAEPVRWDVFLAHAGADTETAQQLYDLLTAAGLSVCFDRAILRAGDDWHALLPKYLRQSSVVVALVSSKTRDAHYERSEIVLAVNLVRREGRRLVPVRLSADAEAPYGAEQLHAIDAFGDAGIARAAEAIADVVRNPELLPCLKPTQVWCDRVPVVTRWFTGRDEFVRELFEEPERKAHRVRTHAITGMGGLGKTTLAAAVAEANRHELDIVWWVRAEQDAMLIADLSELAPLVGLIPTGKGMPDDADGVRQWLEQTNRSWLLVFDNAQTEESLERWRPKRGAGTVVITSRNRHFDRIGSVVELPVLGRAEAEDFLRRRVQDRNADAAVEPEAKTVADRLDGLPLALEQAASWVARAPTRRFSRYLQLLNDVSKEPFPHETRPLGYTATAASTWRISIEAAVAEAPVAEKLMNVLGFFAPEALPVKWLVDEAIAGSEILHCTTEQIDDALVALNDYSLLQLGSDTLSIHRVVQDSSRRTSGKQAAMLAVSIVMNQIAAFERDAGDAPVQSMSVHVTAVCGNSHSRFPELFRDDERMRAFLDSVVNWSDRLRIMSRYFEALQPAGTVFQIRCEAVGLDRPETLLAGRVALHAFEGAGMVRDARTLRYLLDQAELARPETKEHRPSSVLFGPEKINAMASQAEQLFSDGRHEDALAVEQSVLSATGWFYGHESQEVGGVYMALAKFCGEMGRTAAALHFASEGIELLRRYFDDNDPILGLTFLNLSGAQLKARKTDEALDSIQHALRILTARLQQPHTLVGAAYAQLSLILESKGEYSAADEASRKAIETLVAIHGDSHPDVAQALANHALVLEKLGKQSEAIASAERAVKWYTDAYGDDNWQTKWARQILEQVSRASSVRQ
jgi:tetratricopeptide (TPR) repeat protein